MNKYQKYIFLNKKFNYNIHLANNKIYKNFENNLACIFVCQCSNRREGIGCKARQIIVNVCYYKPV